VNERRAAVVGGGPNGLAAAIALAEAGLTVTVLEAAPEIGGGVRSAEMTLPGYVHDVCSAIYPFGRSSPFFAPRQADLERHGLRWVEPRYAIGHPLEDEPAVLVERDVAVTAARLGADGRAYRSLMEPLVDNWPTLMPDVLAPLHVPLWPPAALRLARFGLVALRSARSAARRFTTRRARALWAGAAAHSILPLGRSVSAAAGLVMLASAHADGWPLPVGGAGAIPAALGARLLALGGHIETGRRITAYGELPEHDVALFDVMPGALATICADQLPETYRRTLQGYRHGPGVFKLDLAIEGAIPWRDEELLEAGTVHVGGTLEEIAASEAAVASGRIPERPFVLLAQQSLFDRSRAPEGHNTVWAYCHVPSGSAVDMSRAIIDQVERFAPGFREHILSLRASDPAEIEQRNANYVGGDIGGGVLELGQLFDRPARPWNPYSTPNRAIYICSSATPPGAGVHGMCGLHAARSALRRIVTLDSAPRRRRRQT
jgi:phytoene dehydrogenase-like protein